MSTQFIIANNKTTGERAASMDSEFPEELFSELVSATPKGETFNPNDYTFTLTNYRGDVIEEDWDWTNVTTQTTFGALYGKKEKKVKKTKKTKV